MTITATPTPGKSLISPTDHMLVMIDFQSQMAFATKSIDPTLLRNNAGLVAGAAAGFGVPTILTTVAEKSFSGPMFSEVTDPFPGQKLLDRTSMNTWEDAAVIDEVNRIGKERIVFAGLWTSVCIVGPVASGLSGFPCVAGHNGQQGVPLCHDAKNLPYRMSFSISFWRAALPVPPSSRAVCSIR